MKRYLKYVLGIFMLSLCLLGTSAQVEAAQERQENGYVQPVFEQAGKISKSDIFQQKLSSVYQSKWDKYGTYYYYNQLTETEQRFYEGLHTMCLAYLEGSQSTANGYTQYVDAYGLSFDDIFRVGELFYYSNPQYYFIENRISAGSSTSAGIKSTYAAFGIASDFQNGTKRKEATAKFGEKIAEWEAVIAKQSSYVDKEKTIHDLIVNESDYNLGAANHQSAYGILVEQEAVCMGYANAFALLANGTGIDTITVTSANHAWNLARMEGSWYHVDCTWDDPIVAGGGSVLLYTYFNRSDVMLAKLDTSSHTVLSSWNGLLPVCLKDSGAGAYSTGSITKPSQTVASPVITTKQGSTGVTVTITSSQKGAEIYYTLDGKTPSSSSSKSRKYTGSFVVTSPVSVSAIAATDGFYDSAVVTGTVSIDTVTNAAAPVITKQPVSQTYTFGETAKQLSVYVADEDMANVTYQWYVSSTKSAEEKMAIPNAVQSSYTPPVSSIATAYYYCVITNTDENATGTKAAKTISSVAAISVQKCNVSQVSLSAISSQTYTGAAVKPSVTMKNKGRVLQLNKDYTVAYSNHINVGTAVMTIQGIGNYTGTKKVTFKIQALSLSKASIPSISAQSYTGKAVTPLVTVKYAGKTLRKGTDYTVSYSNNKAIGTATMIVTGKGNYAGTKKITFQIVPGKAVIKSAKGSKKAATVTYKAVSGAKGYQVVYATKKNGTYKVAGTTSAKTFTINKLTKNKTYYVKVRAYKVVNGKTIYGAYSNVSSVKIK